jgi:hypothetical protein
VISLLLFEGGAVDEENCKKCPETTALLDKHIPFNKIGT